MSEDRKNKKYSPKDRKPVTFWMRKELKEKADDFCKQHNLSLTQFIQMAVERALDMELSSPVVPGEKARSLTGLSDELQRKIQLRDELMRLEVRGEKLLKSLEELDLSNLELITTRIEVLKQEIKNELIDETSQVLETNIRNKLRRQLLKEIDEYLRSYEKEFITNIVEDVKMAVIMDFGNEIQNLATLIKDSIFKELEEKGILRN